MAIRMTPTRAPRTHLLSNGRYCVMLSAAGSGYSRWRDIAVTRWREDPTCDPWGSFVFLRDAATGGVWSVGYQPVGREGDRYEAAFFSDRAEINRTDGSIQTATEILVSPEHDAEVRRVSVTNAGAGGREIELSSYAEVVLASAGADSAHPAFSKMFVQTEFHEGSGALLATRRRREPAEPALWLYHVSALEGQAIGGLEFETDRARFIGRGHELRNAASIADARPLSNTAGTVLDPVVSLRRRVRIAPGQCARVAFWTGVARSRAEALALAECYRDTAAFERTKRLARTRAPAALRDLGVDAEEALLFQGIADRVLYCEASLRAPREILDRNELGPSVLWSVGISGDLPIVVLHIAEQSALPIAAQLLRAGAFFRFMQLPVDFVIVNDGPPSQAQELQQALEVLVKSSQTRGAEADEPGHGRVFTLRSDALPLGGRDLLQAAARAIFSGRRGPLSEQLAQPGAAEPIAGRQASGNRAARAVAAHPVAAHPVAAHPVAAHAVAAHPAAPRVPAALEFHNGIGGFAADGREYHIVLDEGRFTPAPWSNVIANPQFGSLVSADGAGCTWSLNAHENQLTPWSNDPVSNAPAEVIYIRDEASGDLCSATPLPIRDPAASYLIRHGFGYTRFEHVWHGLDLELLQFVPLEDPLKISRLRITNRTAEALQLSVTHYLEWVLGSQRSRSAPFIVTEFDPETSALLARNPWNSGFESRIAFMDMGGRQQQCTGDRREFLGRHGSLAEPAALLAGARLSNRVGGGLDPCGALQGTFRLRPGESIDIVLTLGQEASRAQALALIRRYRDLDLDALFKAVTDFWDQTLGTLKVKTPDRSMDVLLNGWLLYQTLACRLWGRAAYYQTSGAYGFRDQLQDVMALAVTRPALVREHVLRAASRQFTAGDVQHWWHPGSGLGVRTRVADDRLWLPFVVAHYLEVTADFGVLDERVGFLEEAPLSAERPEIFSAPKTAPATESLYEHCVRALDSSLGVGSHGLPLFGTGDWNDGMNRVGAAGRGESVWLGWFLHAALLRFAPLADRRGDAAKAASWRRHALGLSAAIEREAWDGDWYRRGYYDDGTPLGSASSEECRIDSIAQSWAVISGAGDPARAARAMQSVDVHLVNRRDALVQLFTPPFDRTALDPGYIKAYPPGLRENGGQYTHAAMWSTLAFALQGDGDRAAELFSLMNPIHHASTRTDVDRYKVEPYVVCADVYSVPPHAGRGGWTWYTGSAGWMYRTAVEGILGIHRRGAVLRINPCIPRAWPGFEVSFTHGSSRYHIAIDNPLGSSRGIARATLDGRDLGAAPCDIALLDDGSPHAVRITLGITRG